MYCYCSDPDINLNLFYFNYIFNIPMLINYELSELIKLLLCGRGNGLLHHPKLLVYFCWLNLL